MEINYFETQFGAVTIHLKKRLTPKINYLPERLVVFSDVADMSSMRRSLMPGGLEGGMSIQDMADLLAFLQQKDNSPQRE